jgi:hypothetical protein
MIISVKCNISLSKKLRALSKRNTKFCMNTNTLINGVGDGTITFEVDDNSDLYIKIDKLVKKLDPNFYEIDEKINALLDKSLRLWHPIPPRAIQIVSLLVSTRTSVLRQHSTT